MKNQKYKVRNIIEWAEGNEPPPVILNLRVTERCNLNCLVCEKGGMNHFFKNEIDEDKLVEIIKEAGEMGVKILQIDGSGEPFFRKETTFKLMEIAKSQNMKGYLVTNTTNLNKQDLERIVGMNWDELQISLDGPDAKTHDFLRQRRGTFKKVTEMIKSLQKLKKEFNKSIPKIVISTVLTNKIHNKIEEMIELVKYLNVERFSLQPLQKRTPVSHDFKLNNEMESNFQSKLDCYLDLLKEYNIKHNLDLLKDNELIENSFNTGDFIREQIGNGSGDKLFLSHCHMPWVYIGVREDGFVEPCFEMEFKAEKIQDKNLREIWYGDFFHNIREALRNGKFYSPCETCCGIQVMDALELKERLRDTS